MKIELLESEILTKIDKKFRFGTKKYDKIANCLVSYYEIVLSGRVSASIV